MMQLKWSMDGMDKNVKTDVYGTEQEVKSAMYKVLHHGGYIVNLSEI